MAVKIILMVKETRLPLICPLIGATVSLCHVEHANSGNVYHSKLASEFLLREDTGADTFGRILWFSNRIR